MSDVKSQKSALEVMAGMADHDGESKDAGTVECPACSGKGRLPKGEAEKVSEALNADKGDADGDPDDSDKPDFGSFAFAKKGAKG